MIRKRNALGLFRFTFEENNFEVLRQRQVMQNLCREDIKIENWDQKSVCDNRGSANVYKENEASISVIQSSIE